MITTIGLDGRPYTYWTNTPQYVPGQTGGASASLFESLRSSSSTAPRAGGGATVPGQKADASRAVLGKDGLFRDPVTGAVFTASEVEKAKAAGLSAVVPMAAGLLSWLLLRK